MRRHRLLLLGLLAASIAQGCLVQVPGRLQTPVTTLGVTRFGQSGALDDVYRYHGIDADSIVRAALDLTGRP